MTQNEETFLGYAAIALVILYMIARSRRRRGRRTAFGTAFWADDKLLKDWGMLANHGIIIGRTQEGALIRASRYCHTLLIGGTGSGKGVGVIIPNLLAYHNGSVVVFDCKGDLHATTAKRRRGRILRVAPFNGGTDTLNFLDSIPADSPLLFDSARAMSESLQVRSGAEQDPYWSDKSANIIMAVMVLVLLKSPPHLRHLGSVQEIISNTQLLRSTGETLQAMGGIAGRLGGQILMLFEQKLILSREGNSVLGHASKSLSFLDSQMIEDATAYSTFDAMDLLDPSVTLYIQIPPDQLEAQKAYLRCIISTLVRVIGSSGSEDRGEVLFLLDEASALGGLAAIEEALVRGRSAGVRMLLAYQSDSQVRTAFPNKPTLLYDNCSTQIHLGASSFEGAERLSKSLGSWTQIIESYSVNDGSSQTSSTGNGGGSGSTNQGQSTSFSQHQRALLLPEEILTLNEAYFIAFQQGLPAPILGRRIRWFEDRSFNPSAKKHRRRRRMSPLRFVWWLSVVAIVCLLIDAWANGKGYWSPDP